MSFAIEWPHFDDSMVNMVKDKLNNILNSSSPDEPSSLPEEIVGPLMVTDVSFGTVAPELDMIDITEMQEEQFKGTFKIQYSGDLFLELTTVVEVNPVAEKNPFPLRMSIHSDLLTEPLHIPLKILISQIKLSGIVHISFTKRDTTTHEQLTASKQAGLVEASFEGDPLVSVSVTSNFESFGAVRKLLQGTIEDFLRQFFQNDFPNIVKKLSTMLDTN